MFSTLRAGPAWHGADPRLLIIALCLDLEVKLNGLFGIGRCVHRYSRFFTTLKCHLVDGLEIAGKVSCLNQMTLLRGSRPHSLRNIDRQHIVKLHHKNLIYLFFQDALYFYLCYYLVSEFNQAFYCANFVKQFTKIVFQLQDKPR